MAYVTLAQAKQYLGTDVYESAYDDRTSPGTPDDAVLTSDIEGITAIVD